MDGEVGARQRGGSVLCSNSHYYVLHRDQAGPLRQKPVPLPVYEERNVKCSCAEQFLHMLAVKGYIFLRKMYMEKGFHVCLSSCYWSGNIEDCQLKIILSSEQ